MEKVLPIGTVVGIKKAKGSLMIVGYDGKSNDDKTDEYVGVVFPQGISEDKTCYGFNSKDIEDIKYVGLINAETQLFIGKKLDNKKE